MLDQSFLIYLASAIIVLFTIIYYLALYRKGRPSLGKWYLTLFVSYLGWSVCTLGQVSTNDIEHWTIINAVSYGFVYTVVASYLYIAVNSFSFISGVFMAKWKRYAIFGAMIFPLYFAFLYQFVFSLTFTPNLFTQGIMEGNRGYGPYYEMHGPLWQTATVLSYLYMLSAVVVITVGSIKSKVDVVRHRCAYTAAMGWIGLHGQIIYMASFRIFGSVLAIDTTLLFTPIGMIIFTFGYARKKNAIVEEGNLKTYHNLLERGLKTGRIYYLDRWAVENHDLGRWVKKNLVIEGATSLQIRIQTGGNEGEEIDLPGKMERINITLNNEKELRNMFNALDQIIPRYQKGIAFITGMRNTMEELMGFSPAQLVSVLSYIGKLRVLSLNRELILVILPGKARLSRLENMILSSSFLWIKPSGQGFKILDKRSGDIEEAKTLNDFIKELRNINRMKSMKERELKVEKNRLEEFIATLSHEISTPLTPLFVWSGRGEVGKGKEQVRYSSERISGTLERGMAKLQSKGRLSTREPVSRVAQRMKLMFSEDDTLEIVFQDDSVREEILSAHIYFTLWKAVEFLKNLASDLRIKVRFGKTGGSVKIEFEQEIREEIPREISEDRRLMELIGSVRALRGDMRFGFKNEEGTFSLAITVPN